MPKILTIKKSRDFKIIQLKAKKKHGLSLILLEYPTLLKANEDANENYSNICRFGITISTKIHKSAVVRNKIRRILKNIIKEILPLIKCKNQDFVIIAKKQILEFDYVEIYNDLKKILIN